MYNNMSVMKKCNFELAQENYRTFRSSLDLRRLTLSNCKLNTSLAIICHVYIFRKGKSIICKNNTTIINGMIVLVLFVLIGSKM